MFLFGTRPAATASPAGESGGVTDALRYGADRTGTDFSYLMRTAERESSLDPNAKAKSSSASGLFQFIEQTWLGVVKATGAKHGLANEAEAISDKGGRLSVQDPAMREKILQMRNDPKISSVMAGELTQKNFSSLSNALGRQPTQGELYAAHFLGASGAAALSQRTQSDPSARAADLFPDEAASNRRIFFDRDGRARSVGDVYSNLTGANNQTAIVKAAASDAVQPVAVAASAAWLGAFPKAPGADGQRVPDSLFNGEVRTGPVSNTVARLWSTGRTAVRSDAGSGSFFPRSDNAASVDGAEAVASTEADPTSASNLPDTAPLPPSRPVLGAKPGSQAGRGHHRAGQPLDLQAFMTRDANS